jgi:UDP-N-acetylglucosamine 2-epimerase (non-hydrolysing)
MKILSVVGARPNFVKMAPIHDAIIASGNEHVIIHTGQHYDYEMSEVFFKDFQLPKPDIDLGVGSGSSCFQIGEILKRLDRSLSGTNVDIVLVYGDTNSTLAGALCASKCDLKLGHVEAGLRSFDKTMPEENNRIIIDHLARYLFAPTRNAKKILRTENVSGKVYYTGDLSVEILGKIKPKSDRSSILKSHALKPKTYLLVTMHRAENTNSKEHLIQLLKSFESLIDFTIVFPIHPRTKKTFRIYGLYKRLLKCSNVKLLSPISYVDFISLLQNASKVITDSGGVQKEAYLLRIPCITIRKNTEWIETLKGNWNVLTGVNSNKIAAAVMSLNPTSEFDRSVFGNGNTAQTIMDMILLLT